MIQDRDKLETQLTVLCSLLDHLEGAGEDMLDRLAGTTAHDGFDYYRKHRKELNLFFRGVLDNV